MVFQFANGKLHVWTHQCTVRVLPKNPTVGPLLQLVVVLKGALRSPCNNGYRLPAL